MTRFAWLQTRSQTLVAVGALAALAAIAAVTGIRLSHLYGDLVVPCQANGDCAPAVGRFLSHYHFLQNALPVLVRAVPALIGMFWGAPLLARELETGTFRLAWTQSVPRSRWLSSKLLVGTVVAAVIAGALTVMVTWWFRDIDLSTNRYGSLDARDLAPIGYAVFAFLLGAFLGAVIRRTMAAIATTLAGFVLARIVIAEWVRPHLLAARHLTSSLLDAQFGFTISNGGTADLVARSPRGFAHAWILSSRIMTSSGKPSTAADRGAFLHRYCPSILTPPPVGGPKRMRAVDVTAFHSCQHHAAQAFHLLVTYQPAARYWAFQWLELGTFLALAALAAAGCYWFVTRRGA